MAARAVQESSPQKSSRSLARDRDDSLVEVLFPETVTVYASPGDMSRQTGATRPDPSRSRTFYGAPGPSSPGRELADHSQVTPKKLSFSTYLLEDDNELLVPRQQLPPSVEETLAGGDFGRSPAKPEPEKLLELSDSDFEFLQDRLKGASRGLVHVAHQGGGHSSVVQVEATAGKRSWDPQDTSLNMVTQMVRSPARVVCHHPQVVHSNLRRSMGLTEKAVVEVSAAPLPSVGVGRPEDGGGDRGGADNWYPAGPGAGTGRAQTPSVRGRGGHPDTPIGSLGQPLVIREPNPVTKHLLKEYPVARQPALSAHDGAPAWAEGHHLEGGRMEGNQNLTWAEGRGQGEGGPEEDEVLAVPLKDEGGTPRPFRGHDTLPVEQQDYSQLLPPKDEDTQASLQEGDTTLLPQPDSTLSSFREGDTTLVPQLDSTLSSFREGDTTLMPQPDSMVSATKGEATKKVKRPKTRVVPSRYMQAASSIKSAAKPADHSFKEKAFVRKKSGRNQSDSLATSTGRKPVVGSHSLIGGSDRAERHSTGGSRLDRRSAAPHQRSEPGRRSVAAEPGFGRTPVVVKGQRVKGQQGTSTPAAGSLASQMESIQLSLVSKSARNPWDKDWVLPSKYKQAASSIQPSGPPRNATVSQIGSQGGSKPIGGHQPDEWTITPHSKQEASLLDATDTSQASGSKAKKKKSGEVTQHDLDMLYARYLQQAFLDFKIQKTLEEQEERAMSQIYGLWNEVERMKKKEADLKLELAQIKHGNKLDGQLQLQSQGLEPVVSGLSALANKYQMLASALDTTRHQLPTSAIHTPSNEDQHLAAMVEALTESERLLAVISRLASGRQPQATSLAKAVHAIDQAVGKECQELESCEESLAAMKTLATMEMSLKVQEIQKKRQTGTFLE